MTNLSLLANWKGDFFNFILVFINWLIKIVHYKLVKTTINAPRLAKVIIDVVIQQHGLFNSIMTNKGLLFTFKFWLLPCYFFSIKKMPVYRFLPIN